MSDYQIETIEDEKYSSLVDGIDLFMNKKDQYYSKPSEFTRDIISCSILHVHGEYKATIIYKDTWNDD